MHTLAVSELMYFTLLDENRLSMNISLGSNAPRISCLAIVILLMFILLVKIVKNTLTHWTLVQWDPPILLLLFCQSWISVKRKQRLPSKLKYGTPIAEKVLISQMKKRIAPPNFAAIHFDAFWNELQYTPYIGFLSGYNHLEEFCYIFQDDITAFQIWHEFSFSRKGFFFTRPSLSLCSDHCHECFHSTLRPTNDYSFLSIKDKQIQRPVQHFWWTYLK